MRAFDDDDDDDRDYPPDPEDRDESAAEEKCPSCGAWVIEDCQQCPECGEWIMPGAGPELKGRGWLWVALGLGALILLLWRQVLR